MFLRNIGLPELILVLGLALLIFGPGRIAKLGSELGRSIKAFQEGLQGDKNKTPNTAPEEKPEEKL